MSTPSPPIGQESWLAYLEESSRNIHNVELCTVAIENYRRSVEAEPGSLALWTSYCEFFHKLYVDSLNPRAPGSKMARWPSEDLMIGREMFTLDSTLQLWQRGYEAIRYRLNDSHLLWNRWIDLEMEQLMRTRTPDGIRRITHLYRNRLQTPHVTWSSTSSKFSSFLSEYNQDAWEVNMQQVTEAAQAAKAIMQDHREDFEYKLQRAHRENRHDLERTVLLEYIDWEVNNAYNHIQQRSSEAELVHEVCSGLFSRALTGMFSRDEGVWVDYVSHLCLLERSSSLSTLMEVLHRATDHCPWSGSLWSRYILTAEQAGTPFEVIENIKHSATAAPQLLEGGLESLLSMYISWCGYLKRRAVEVGGEALDLADMGFAAALEDIRIHGRKLYNDEYEGDPQFRVERIFIEYLTEAKRNLPEARAYWEGLSKRRIYAKTFAFWQQYFQWEMFVYGHEMFSSGTSTAQTPTRPSGPRTPFRAMNVLRRAIDQTVLDFPTEMLQLYIQHCNEYQPVATIWSAQDLARRLGKGIAKRREQEAQVQAEKQAVYVAQQVQQQAHAELEAKAESDRRQSTHTQGSAQASPTGKRKRDDGDIYDLDLSKRIKHDAVYNGGVPVPGRQENTLDAKPKRDREHTTALVSGLPKDVTVGAIKKNFREFGHIVEVHIARESNNARTSLAMVEFDNSDDAATFIALRNNKYFGEYQIQVCSGFHLTVFVTNFPPTADNAFMHHLFKNCGEIIDIRWPSLKFNVTRRFCYVTFRTLEGSTAAVSLNKRKIDNHRVEIAFSDPANKRKRQGATSEGREVFITNVDGDATDEELRAVFEKYGSVDSVRVLRFMNGRPHGTAFVVFEKKEEAEKSVAELNNVKFKSRIMRVEISQPRNFKMSAKTRGDSPAAAAAAAAAGAIDSQGDDSAAGDSEKNFSTAPSAEIDARSMALMNLADTVNDARVKALVAPFGTILRLVLLPAQGSAKVEFNDAAAAGKAQLGLNGHQFEGRKLRTGTLRDLHSGSGRGGPSGSGSSGKAGASTLSSSSSAAAAAAAASQSTTAATKMFVPTKRLPFKNAAKGRGLVVSSVKKGAPTLTSPAPTVAVEGSDDKEENKGNGNGMKSNAHFKAIFLAGKK